LPVATALVLCPPMLYYDRQLPLELATLLLPGQPLAWLVEYVRADSRLRIEFRRADQKRRWGSIQIYQGRTSPLEVLGQATASVKISADEDYRKHRPDLFVGALDPSHIELELRRHLALCTAAARAQFTEGEGAIHNALLRRYGLLYRDDDPLVAVDSEVRIGFRKDDRFRTGSEHRDAHLRHLKRDLGVTAERGHTKLDGLGILSSGELALVEVKDEHGDIGTAARQLAAHLYTFGVLLKQSGDAAEAINGLVAQKVRCGLIPTTKPLPRLTHSELVAAIAAPEPPSSDWVQRWRAGIGHHLKMVPGVSFRVELWRLSTSGEIAESQHL